MDKFWIRPSKDAGTFEMGLTDEYIKRLGPIWSFVPREPGEQLKKGMVFANIESGRCLGPLRSPVTAKIEGWAAWIFEDPDIITADLAICLIREVQECAA